MNICACGGNKKLIIEDYIIRTRMPGCRRIVVKNIRHKRCKICGYTELTEDSKKYIDSVKDYYLKKNPSSTTVQDRQIEDSNIRVSKLLKLFRL